MTPFLRWNLVLVITATLWAASPEPAQVASGQGAPRRSADNSAESDRNRDDAGAAGFRGRRGGRAGRFDRRGEASPETADASRSPATRPAASDNRSDADRLRSYAKSLVERYDKNGNMMLEAAERTELRGKPAEADLNHDDVITLDELVTHLSGQSAGAQSSSVGAAASASFGTASQSDAAVENRSNANRGEPSSQPARRTYGGASSDAKAAAAKRKSYRFTPPAERLPSGLLSWFKSRDANGDGQVAMHEYSRSWSDRTAAEFIRYDKDNNGVITPDEASQR